MDYLTSMLINLIVAEYYAADRYKCGKFITEAKFEEEFLADLKDAFSKYGYEQAKGLFLMDYQAQM